MGRQVYADGVVTRLFSIPIDVAFTSHCAASGPWGPLSATPFSANPVAELFCHARRRLRERFLQSCPRP